MKTAKRASFRRVRPRGIYETGSTSRRRHDPGAGLRRCADRSVRCRAPRRRRCRRRLVRVDPALHRIHESIPEENMEKINGFLRLFSEKKKLKSLSYNEIKKAIEAYHPSNKRSQLEKTKNNTLIY